MKPAEIRELTEKELNEKIVDMKAELFNLRFSAATGQLDNYRRIRDTRREIARFLTVEKERDESAEGKASGPGEANA